MKKGKGRSTVTHHVALELQWSEDKWETINELATRNGISLADMVDTILDDWATLANKELGVEGIPRVLEVGPVIPENGR